MKSSLRQIATPQHRSRPRGNDRPCLKTRPSGQHPRRRFLALTAGAAALPAVSRIVWAQTYPTRPITIVVGYAAGGPTDIAARILAERLKPLLGQAVLVENVTGANGSIGVGRVVRAAPDGYTLSLGDLGTHVVNQVTYPLAYDLRTDLQPIALLATLSALVVARNGMPGGNLTELVAWLRANPNKASAGIGGVAGTDHLAGLMFQNITGTRVQFIPNRGSAPAVQDMLAGQIDMMFTFPAVTLPYIQAGRIKAYAAMAKGRLAAAPGIPTVDEAGVPGAYFSTWFSLWASKGTPKDIVAGLNSAIAAALAGPAIKARFADLGFDVAPPDQQSPDGLATLQKAEIDRWWPIIKAANIKGE
jgi:tripartite-type tricarboxylate transporter receptor subunit TctC